MPGEARQAGSHVSVVVRIRPPLQQEATHGHCTWVKGRRIHLAAGAPEGRRKSAPGTQDPRVRAVECEYDKVLDMCASQDDVWQSASPMIEKALEGYNATVLTYGMTGSGKTWTMLGPTLMGAACEGVATPSAQQLQQCSQRGLVPRVVQHVFQSLHQKQRAGEVSVALSYMQIYQERCFDLLRPPSHAKPLRLREVSAGHASSVVVEGLREDTVDSAEACLERLAYGFSNVAFRATNYNEQSSRSHSVLTLNIRRLSAGGGVATQSKICLVDLAGNERWDTFGADMTRLHSRELASINKSLHVLGICIQALSQNPAVSKRDGQRVMPHVPYRDSALTMLLRESLSGNSWTTVLCTICGSSLYQVQSLCTLRFADRAKRVKMHAKVAEAADEREQEQSELAYLRSLVAGGATKDPAAEQQQRLLEQQVGELERANHSLRGENESLKERLTNMSVSNAARPQAWADLAGSSGSSRLAALLAPGLDAPRPALQLGRRLRRCCSEPALPVVEDAWLEAMPAAAETLRPPAKMPQVRSSPSEPPAPRRRAAETPPPPPRPAQPRAPDSAALPSPRRRPPAPAATHHASGRAPAQPEPPTPRRRHPSTAQLPPAAALEESRAARLCPKGHRLVALGSSCCPIGKAAYSVWHCDMAPECTNGSCNTPHLGRFHCARCSHDLCEQCFAAPATPAAEPMVGQTSESAAASLPACERRSSAVRQASVEVTRVEVPAKPPRALSPAPPHKPRAPSQPPPNCRPAAGPGASPRRGGRAAPASSLRMQEVDRSLKAKLLDQYKRKVPTQDSLQSTATPSSSLISTGMDAPLKLPQLPSPRSQEVSADSCAPTERRWWHNGAAGGLQTPRREDKPARSARAARSKDAFDSIGGSGPGGVSALLRDLDARRERAAVPGGRG